MFIAALIIIAKRRKQTKCPSMDEWIRKMWDIHKMEYYSPMKRSEVLILATTWNLENRMLSKEARLKRPQIV